MKIKSNSSSIYYRIGSIDASGNGRINYNKLYDCDSLLLKRLLSSEEEATEKMCIIPFFEIQDNQKTFFGKFFKFYDFTVTLVNPSSKKISRNFSFNLKVETGKLLVLINDDKSELKMRKLRFCVPAEIPNCSVK